MVQGWARCSIAPRRPQGDSRPERWQKRVSGEVTHSETGIFVIVPVRPSGKMPLMFEGLGDNQRSANPSAASARSAWERTGACQPT